MAALWAGIALKTMGQSSTDSINAAIEKYKNRNFSEMRTLNLTWEFSPSTSYRLKPGQADISDKSKFENSNTVKFQANIPIVRKPRFTLYGVVDFNSYHLKTEEENVTLKIGDENASQIFYRAGAVGQYTTRLFARPFVLRSSLAVNGWTQGLKQTEMSITGMSVVKHSQKNTVTVGLSLATPFEGTPIIPLVMWTHRFSDRLILDAIMPSRTYLRYQYDKHRLSAGIAVETDKFYMRPHMPALPSTVLFSHTYLKHELVYECILSNHCYIVAKAGVKSLVKGGLYEVKSLSTGDALVKASQDVTTAASIGFSYTF